MFVWECLKTEGKHLGMCMDGFMFGSCCVHDDDSNKVVLISSTEKNNGVLESSTTQAPSVLDEVSTQTSEWPTRPSRPTKTPNHNHHNLVKWPSFHLVDQKIGLDDGNDEELEDKIHQQHFIDVKLPEDPRAQLTTR